jgi:hypothetical protein
MTPQEKANELLIAFHEVPFKNWSTTDMPHAKQSALIAVSEILKYQKIVLETFPSDGYEPNYWNQVKQEVEKL